MEREPCIQINHSWHIPWAVGFLMLCSALGRTIIISHVIICVHMLSLSIAGISCLSWIVSVFKYSLFIHQWKVVFMQIKALLNLISKEKCNLSFPWPISSCTAKRSQQPLRWYLRCWKWCEVKWRRCSCRCPFSIWKPPIWMCWVLAASTEMQRSCVSVHYLPTPRPKERSSGKDNCLL